MTSKLTFKANSASRVQFPFVTWDGFFSPADVAQLVKYCDTVGVQPSTVFAENGNVVDENIRKSDTMFHEPNPQNMHWFNKFKDAAEIINTEFFRYDLTGFEFFQYAVYDGAGSNYNFHMDMMLGDQLPLHMVQTRKLSFSIVLSDPKDFTGGEFEVQLGNNQIVPVEQKLGRIIAFPSWILHRVAPIKTGKRKSIVFWVLGPKFK